jgi:hypothetical protein
MRRAILSLALLALLVTGASRASAGGLDLRLGAYFPRGNETLFLDDRSLYFVEKSDFYGFYGGGEFNHVLTDNVELGLSFDGYSQTVDTSYRDYERPGGGEIYQSLKFNMLPLGLSVRFLPTSKKAKFVPYVGAGVDAIFYQYEEWGDFIDFADPELPIYADAFVSDGTAFGFHALGGLRVYVNRDIAIVGEGRYQWATEEMGDDFSPNEPGLVNTIDLSGWTATLGVHVRF